MVSIFLYEYATGGGALSSPDNLPDSILAEGKAMISALAADFCALDGAQVFALRDTRISDFSLATCTLRNVSTPRQEHDAFRELALQADWSIIVAPEFDGILHDRTNLVIASGGQLLGPPPDVVALASDKHRTALHLRASGVPAPEGRILAAGESLPRDFCYPAVLKPVDGAGSLGVQRIDGADQELPPRTESFRFESFCSGIPASVALLCGPRGQTALPPCRQTLAQDGGARYLGGSLPLPQGLAERAERLACQAAESLPGTRGYLGVDLILGEPPDGSADYVIEINPRLTTSYVGLRAATEDNLAQALLAVVNGSTPALNFRSSSIGFTADGSVTSTGCTSRHS